MYEPIVWVDESDEFEDRFTETQNSDGTISHNKVRGEVYVEGTPQDAAHFNHQEAGILDAHLAASEMLIYQRQSEWRIKDLEKATIQETGTVTLTNTMAFPFNDSKKTVSLANARDNLNYVVVVVSKTANDNGNIGDIEISERQVNGFKIEHTGSAKSVTVVYAVIGGYN